MSRKKNKKKQLNYKPIIIGAAIAIPLLVLLVILRWPKPLTEVVFEVGPVCDGRLTESGSVRVSWQTNVPTWCTVFYRYEPASELQHITTAQEAEHSVSLPGKPGHRLVYFVEAKGAGQLKRSQEVSVMVTAASSLPSTRDTQSD